MAQVCTTENPGNGLPEDERTSPAFPGRSETPPPGPDPAAPFSTDSGTLALRHGAVFGGRFKLRRALGSGDEGGVWLATDERFDRPVTLKLLPETICGDAGALAELREIVRRSSELVHANIARAYEFIEAEQVAAAVLEYVDGESLTQLRLERPQQVFEVSGLASWVGALCGALEYAHGRMNLVHGGLRPDNVLVDATGRLKLTGFGLGGRIKKWLARLGARRMTTPASVHPAQLADEEPAVSDDVYGAGAILYELLTGTAPFESGQQGESGIQRPVTSMAERRAQRGIKGEPIPVAWEQTVAACLAGDPAQRPPSAAELAAGLANRA